MAEFDLDEPTMAEKLASLDLQNGENEKSDVEKASSPTIKPPSADSVHVLLKQALHADDHSLLLDCLYTRDEKVWPIAFYSLDVVTILFSAALVCQNFHLIITCLLLCYFITGHCKFYITFDSSRCSQAFKIHYVNDPIKVINYVLINLS